MGSVADAFRENPKLKWAIGLVVVLAAISLGRLLLSGPSDDDVLSSEYLAQGVTVRYTDTNKEVEVPMGRVVRELMNRAGIINPEEGLYNDETKKNTGFFTDRDEWEELIRKLNTQRGANEAAAPQRGVTGPKAPSPPRAPAAPR